jgi:predicted nucleotide-binding protein
VSYRRPIGDRAALSSADAFDSALRHPRAGRPRRVFITRTDSEKVLQHVKELVASGPFEPVVARERGAAAAPLLYDLINQMRGCDTAIIHVTGGPATGDRDREPLSGDVLIEIGAAMALYGREFVLLLDEAIELPPNLRGLRECRYRGDELNKPEIVRLLRAFSSFMQWPSGIPVASSAGASSFWFTQQADAVATKH